VCGFTVYISKVLCVCSALLKITCSFLMWHLEQVMFWNKMFSETEPSVIARDRVRKSCTRTDTGFTHVADAM